MYWSMEKGTGKISLGQFPMALIAERRKNRGSSRSRSQEVTNCKVVIQPVSDGWAFLSGVKLKLEGSRIPLSNVLKPKLSPTCIFFFFDFTICEASSICVIISFTCSTYLVGMMPYTLQLPIASLGLLGFSQVPSHV